MIIVLSGEGPTDLGSCTFGLGQCRIPEFELGPMTLLADLIITEEMGYSLLESTPQNYFYISEKRLEELEEERKRGRRHVLLPGKKTDQETGYFYINAWVLGEAALQLGRDKNDNDLIALLFRDTDGTRSTAKGLWDSKWASMVNGFNRSGLRERGVPMLPKPKSEAWLLCAMKVQPYQHCRRLEELSGNDNAPESAKRLLEVTFGAPPSRVGLVDWMRENKYDWLTAAEQMQSLGRFVDRLRNALQSVLYPSREEPAT